MHKIHLLFFVAAVSFSKTAFAHDILVDTYRSASSTINSFGYNWKQQTSAEATKEESLYDISLGYSLGHTEAFDLNNVKVDLITNELNASMGLATSEDIYYSVGYTNSNEKVIDVLMNSAFFQIGKKYYYADADFFSKIKIKGRLDLNYIQHNPITRVNFDTSLFKSSAKVAAYFYFHDVMNLTLGLKKYYYNKNIDTFVADLKTISSNSLSNIFANEVASYVDYNLSAGLGFDLTENLSADFAFAISQPTYSTGKVTNDYSVSLNYDFTGGLNLACEFGSTNYIAGSKALTTSTSYSQFSLGYSF